MIARNWTWNSGWFHWLSLTFWILTVTGCCCSGLREVIVALVRGGWGHMWSTVLVLDSPVQVTWSYRKEASEGPLRWLKDWSSHMGRKAERAETGPEKRRLGRVGAESYPRIQREGAKSTGPGSFMWLSVR